MGFGFSTLIAKDISAPLSISKSFDTVSEISHDWIDDKGIGARYGPGFGMN